ncbi:hypothetical protein PPYR_13852 [Photinus pyralis]|uniref:Uncharacterized protein n=1 Tax=Photinus pyralis TaxID=7054 RepID=A0A1Y1M9V4_PHOPY|nr:prostate stem cell antigen-like isoform X1 [Photinus pyralis]XP_031355576.1 prostate stem cell antigen-like isoform X1 [Photinus pyralis]KAB0794223.1 hypothetical protein PPYR_13843 [Photinus pyralis]KAB0794232.1 hypothetical protein PPYR_13852 [Photinus pyralis]
MKGFLLLLASGLLLHEGAALKCYNCQSTDTNDCTDLPKVQIVDCDPTRDALSPVCIRRVLQSSLGTNLTLQCLYKSTGNECDSPSATHHVTKCRLCRENLCNHSGIPYQSLAYQLTCIYFLSILIKMINKYM